MSRETRSSDTLDPTNAGPVPHTRCYIGDLEVGLRSDLRPLVEDFAHLYPSEPRSKPRRPPSVYIEVRRVGRTWYGSPRYQAFADGKEVGKPRASNGVFPMVEWGINLRTIALRCEFLQLHAASMVYDGAGFIFAGESGSGKSTLAAILLANGWQYLCDEFALIEPKSAVLHPYPKALCIKAGSFPVVRRLGLPVARRRDYVKAYKGRVAYINPHDLGPDAVGEPSPARFLVFPRYRQGGKAGLLPMPRSRAALYLMRCCFNRQSLPDAGLPALTDLVSRLECFLLDVGEPEETSLLLDSLVRPASSSRPAGMSRQPAHAPGWADSVPEPEGGSRSRREVLQLGAKLAYVLPVVLTLSSRQAFATESHPSLTCSGVPAGGLCETDTDCCSGDCDVGICQ